MERSKISVLLSAVLLVLAVTGLSFFFTGLWGGKMEKPQAQREIVLRFDMTVAEFGRANGLENKDLDRIFGLAQLRDYGGKLQDTGLTDAEVRTRTKKTLAMAEEFAAKNWVKIPVKIGLWLGMMALVFRLLRKGGVRSTGRKWLYLAAVLVFGVILGNEPSPMNTLTDTIAIFGAKGIIFPPRMVMLVVFLAITVLANKLICGWGCQFGALQDLLFRLNRDKDNKSIITQRKVPFAVTNTVRAVVFVAFPALALGWATDIISPVNPFKIYNPLMVTGSGIAFLAAILAASLFVYRPWCHAACPFGFLGWLGEKASLFRIRVNYDTCIACEKCAKACPSTVMDAILKQDRATPDCFSCGACMEACPTRSISFRRGKRVVPPAGKFSGFAGRQPDRGRSGPAVY